MWSTAHAQERRPLTPGTTAAGTVADRYGEEWAIHGCAGDALTIEMQGSKLDSYLELFGPTGPDPLAKDDNSGGGKSARITNYQVPQSGEYTVVARGANIRERGAYSITLTVSGTVTTTTPIGLSLIPSQTMTGTVSDRIGEEWSFFGCARDTVTLAMQSTRLDGFLELYGPTGIDPLASDDNSGGGKHAHIANYSLPQSGDYTVVARGANIRERGVYSLTLLLTNTVTTTNVLTSPLCTIIASPAIRLRPGPGTHYNPEIARLPTGTKLLPRARTAAGNWIQVQVDTADGQGEIGWVNSIAEFISCTMPIATLPLGVLPPTPLPATAMPLPATATPMPPTATSVLATATSVPATATPMPPQLPQLPNPEGSALQAPGEPGDLQGDLFTTTALRFDDDGEPVFGDVLAFELFVRDPRADPYDPQFGIERVEFTISCPDGSEYTHTETGRRYCAFGGGENASCPAIRVQFDSFLPDSQCRIEDREFYNIEAVAIPTNPEQEQGNWIVDFMIDLPGEDNNDNNEDNTGNNGSNGEPLPLVLELAQGGDSSSLTFQVITYDPTVGGNDGNGIAAVDLWVSGPNGDVYNNTEETPGYCAFGGGEPDCTIYFFAENEFVWPTGEAIEFGVNYTLHARAYAEDGRQIESSWSFIPE